MQNVSPLGPRGACHSRVALCQPRYSEGARDNDTLLHTTPEALDRMYGHCIMTTYTDKKEEDFIMKTSYSL